MSSNNDMKEIGSIFEIDPKTLFKKGTTEGQNFPFARHKPYFFQYFNTCRAAIESLFLSIHKASKTCWLPSFICTSVYDSLLRAGTTVYLYPINKDLTISSDVLSHIDIKNGDVFYVMHYFGRVISDEVMMQMDALREKGVIIVEDITLALLSNVPGKIGFGDYVIGSIRKWFALPDGGFIASLNRLPEYERSNEANDYTLNYLTAQLMKFAYIKENRSLPKDAFLQISQRGMKALLSDNTIRHMSTISTQLLSQESIESVIEARIRNYDLLYDMIHRLPKIEVLVSREAGAVPLCMVVYVSNRDELFQHYINNGVYCNIHWRPNELADTYESTKDLSRHCISIPCDQRYDESDMLYIANTTQEFIEGDHRCMLST